MMEKMMIIEKKKIVDSVELSKTRKKKRSRRPDWYTKNASTPKSHLAYEYFILFVIID